MATAVDLEADIPEGASPVTSRLFSAPSADAHKFMGGVLKKQGSKKRRRRHFRRAHGKEKKKGVTHPMFMVSKSDPKKWRDVLNLKALLNLLPWRQACRSFNESTPLDQRPSVRPGSISEVERKLSFMHRVKGVPTALLRLAVLDIAEAYKHLRIDRTQQRQLMFVYAGLTYICCTLPFGSAASASIWIRMGNLMQAFWSSYGIASIVYIDDILIIAVGAAQSHTAIVFVRRVLAFCGVKVNQEKSDTHGFTERTYIGAVFNTQRWTIKIKESVIGKLLEACDDLLSGRTGAGDSLDRIAGSIMFVAQVIRPLKPVAAHFVKLKKAAGYRYHSAETLHYINLVRELVGEHNERGIVWGPHEMALQHDMRLASDASGTGMGAVGFDIQGNMYYIQEEWSYFDENYGDYHINDQEWLAHHCAVTLLREHIGPGYRVIPALVDNKSAEAWCNKLYARINCTEEELHRDEHLYSYNAAWDDGSRTASARCGAEEREDGSRTASPGAGPPVSHPPRREHESARTGTGHADRHPPRSDNSSHSTTGAGPPVSHPPRAEPGPPARHPLWYHNTHRLDWLVSYAQYQESTECSTLLTYVNTHDNVLPDALTRADKQSIFDSFAISLQLQGRQVIRVRPSRTWTVTSWRHATPV